MGRLRRGFYLRAPRNNVSWGKGGDKGYVCEKQTINKAVRTPRERVSHEKKLIFKTPSLSLLGRSPFTKGEKILHQIPK